MPDTPSFLLALPLALGWFSALDAKTTLFPSTWLTSSFSPVKNCESSAPVCRVVMGVESGWIRHQLNQSNNGI